MLILRRRPQRQDSPVLRRFMVASLNTASYEATSIVTRGAESAGHPGGPRPGHPPWHLACHCQARCAAWHSGTPDRFPLCAAAPAQRGRGPVCTHRHPPKSRCAGSPAFLWPRNPPAAPCPQKRAGCVGANRSVPGQSHRLRWPGERRCPAMKIGNRCRPPPPQTPHQLAAVRAAPNALVREVISNHCA